MALIPPSWKNCTLEDIASIVSGGTPKSTVTENFCETGGVAWLTPADLSGYEVKTISRGKRNLTDIGYQSCSAKKMPKGSVLYSSRAPIGYVVIAENEISTNQGFKSFVPERGIDSSYLYYYLKSIKHIAEAKATGTTFKELSGTATKSLPFVAAPENEQKRIVEKLDSLLAQVEIIQQRLNNLPGIIKRFHQSVLAAAVSGKLTEQWRGKRDYAFTTSQLIKLANFIDYRGKTPRKTESGVPLITAKNIKNGYISREPREFIAKDDYESWMTRGIPNVGDVLMTTEAPLGNVALIDIEEKFVLAQRAICFQFNDEINSKYAAFYMSAQPFQDELWRQSTGSTVKGIKATLLKKINITYPPKEEQTEIVRFVEQYFALADTLEKHLANAKARVDNLTQSILAKAFRGELVPQDPNDEPADKLLERIKAARLEAEKLEKAAKKAAKVKR